MNRNLAVFADPLYSNASLDAWLHELIMQAMQRFDVKAAVVILSRGNCMWLQCAEGFTLKKGPPRTPVCELALLDNEIFIIPDVAHDKGISGDLLFRENPRIRFFASCPIWGRGGAKLGAFCLVHDTSRQLGEVELGLLQDMANETATRLNDWNRFALDPATGIFNENGFLLMAERMLAVGEAGRQNACLILMSAITLVPNRFVEISELDIATFVDVMKHAFRDTDCIGRLAEKEFAVLLPGVDKMQGAKAVTRFRAKLQQCNLELKKALPLGSVHRILEYAPTRHRGILDLLQENDCVA